MRIIFAVRLVFFKQIFPNVINEQIFNRTQQSRAVIQLALLQVYSEFAFQ